MALTDTAVTTNQVSASSGVATSTTTFSPGANSLVVVVASWLFSTNATGVTWTCQDSNSVSYASAVQTQDINGVGGSMIFWHVYSGAQSNITVKVTSSNAGTADCQISPRIITGQAASPIGPNTLSTHNSSNQTSVTGSLTTTQAGSLCYFAADWAASTSASAGANTTIISTWSDAGLGDTGVSGVSTSVTSVPGATTFGFTAGSATEFGLVGIEVLPLAGSADMPRIQPGPLWLDMFKPGLPRSRPFQPNYTETETGSSLSIVLPVPLTTLNGLDTLRLDQPQIQPGPAWLDAFKPGLRKPRPLTPSFGIGLSGEFGPFNVVLPVPVLSLNGLDTLRLDQPKAQPGPTWTDLFKPGLPRPRPPAPVPPNTFQEKGSLSVPLPVPALVLSGTRLRSPENLGAVLVLPSPAGATVEVTEGATCTLPSPDGTLALVTLSATTVGWTMQTAPLNLLEFNDVTIDIAITQNGSPYNLTGVTVNMLFKSQAGTPDGSALIFSSGGGSPAITVTNAVGGLAVAQIPNTDLDSEVYFFYRIDVVNSGFTNTCLSGPITWTSL